MNLWWVIAVSASCAAFVGCTDSRSSNEPESTTSIKQSAPTVEQKVHSDKTARMSQLKEELAAKRAKLAEAIAKRDKAYRELYDDLTPLAENRGYAVKLKNLSRTGLFEVRDASLWIKTDGQEVGILMLANVDPLPPSSECLVDDRGVRTSICRFAGELTSLLKKHSPLLHEPATSGASADYLAVVQVGVERCTVRWMTEANVVPDADSRLIVIATKHGEFTAEQMSNESDNTPATIDAMRRLMTGARP